MTQIFTINDDTVVINKLSVGNTDLTGTLTISDKIIVDTIEVKNLVTNSIPSESTGNWTVNEESDLNGKGFGWNWGEGSVQLIYRTGNRLWSNGDFDLSSDRSYKIDNIEVLSLNQLGPQVSKSNLTQVGSLKSLKVIGDTNIGEFAFFNTTYNRLGLGTEEPNSSISIIENDVELGIGSPRYGLATIGTYSNHSLDIVTDNTARISVKNDGEIHIGNETSKNSVLRVYGSLYVDNLVTDTRVERTSPIEFTSSRDQSIYGKGLIWTGNGETRRLILDQNPDRLWSSESFDLAADQAYYINGYPVLTSTRLGDSILQSKLTSVGTLIALNVSGESFFTGTIDASTVQLKSKFITFNDGNNQLEVNSAGFNGSNIVNITVQQSEVLYADSNEISIGDRHNTRKPVKVFGPLSIGISNPDPTVGLSINGNISFANKKFITGTSSPTSGSFVKGDICWNQNPTEFGYVGWICLVDGDPGEWAPFGAIGHQ